MYGNLIFKTLNLFTVILLAGCKLKCGSDPQNIGDLLPSPEGIYLEMAYPQSTDEESVQTLELGYLTSRYYQDQRLAIYDKEQDPSFEQKEDVFGQGFAAGQNANKGQSSEDDLQKLNTMINEVFKQSEFREQICQECPYPGGCIPEVKIDWNKTKIRSTDIDNTWNRFRFTLVPIYPHNKKPPKDWITIECTKCEAQGC
jgi:hypothetical protein